MFTVVVDEFKGCTIIQWLDAPNQYTVIDGCTADFLYSGSITGCINYIKKL